MIEMLELLLKQGLTIKFTPAVNEDEAESYTLRLDKLSCSAMSPTLSEAITTIMEILISRQAKLKYE